MTEAARVTEAARQRDDAINNSVPPPPPTLEQEEEEAQQETTVSHDVQDQQDERNTKVQIPQVFLTVAPCGKYIGVRALTF